MEVTEFNDVILSCTPLIMRLPSLLLLFVLAANAASSQNHGSGSLTVEHTSTELLLKQNTTACDSFDENEMKQLSNIEQGLLRAQKVLLDKGEQSAWDGKTNEDIDDALNISKERLHSHQQEKVTHLNTPHICYPGMDKELEKIEKVLRDITGNLDHDARRRTVARHINDALEEIVPKVPQKQ
ncbi:hypothetical protein RB195_011783 [Necator americanus]|uniref:SXP/RAL-2 family protein Ani s 5-like cation-binding domain-containing protein n=1 Tax=Necator americanus TaxID=51031 RepID=A0ABR1D5P9_NECAM